MTSNASYPQIIVDKQAGTLTVVLPLKEGKSVDDLPLSKSKKSRTVATTHGVVKTGTNYLGREIRIGVNAFVPAHH